MATPPHKRSIGPKLLLELTALSPLMLLTVDISCEGVYLLFLNIELNLWYINSSTVRPSPLSSNLNRISSQLDRPVIRSTIEYD